MLVKICGITNEDDALLAVAMGADAISFVFAPSSRQIAPVRATEIARRVPSEVLTLGVFRNESRERVVQIVNRSGLGGAQLHGHETPEDTAWIRERIPRVVKAFVAGSTEAAAATAWGPDPILLDAPVPGSGEPYDWTLAQATPPGLRRILAGGLTPDNVAEAIAQAQPWGVDISSGVEKSKGRKDPVKLRHFIRNAKEAASLVTAPTELPTMHPDTASDPHASGPASSPYDWVGEG